MLQQLKPALQYSDGRSRPWSGAKLLNLFAEKADGDKAEEFAVMLTPGLVEFASIYTGSPLRGMHVMNGVMYVVCGSNLYSIDQAGTVTEFGGFLGSGRVRMQDNGTQLAICAAPIGYIFEASVITAPATLPAVSDVAYIDSYFVWTIADSDQSIYSAPSDGLTYDALDIFSAEGSPDGLVGVINDHRELLMCGSGTIEIFYNAGGGDDAFQRQGNAFIERGVFSRDSIVKIDNGVHFFGNDRIVYRLDGYNPVRISTHAIEYHLRNVQDVWAFTYTQEGHKFYVLCTEQGTWAYDMATGAWHERRSTGKDNYRVGFAVTAWGQTYMGSNDNSDIWYPDLDVYTEDGEYISAQIDLPSIESNQKLLTMYMFQLYCETGVGLNSGQGSDPQVMLTYSDDGGRTYSNELWRSLGGIGQYRTRVVWRSLGQFRQRDIRLVITDPVRQLTMKYLADVR